MSSLKDRLTARRAATTKDTASLSAEMQAAPADETCAKASKDFEIETEKDFPFYSVVAILHLGGAMLQNGELLPLNFEYLGREQAQEFFKNFGALYDLRRKKTFFFLGARRFCWLDNSQLFNPADAEYIKYFLGKIQEIKAENTIEIKDKISA